MGAAMAKGAQKEIKTSSDGAEVHRADSAGLEDDIENRLIACRDMLVGLWAGAQFGLPEESRAIYALGVMVAGLMGPEPDDVVDKIAHDFTEQGILISRGQILVQLSKKHRLVAMQPAGAVRFLGTSDRG
jgi:hypothetical protein